MRRYWVKLTLEVHSYDEDSQRIGSPLVKFEPATNLTPEPDKFIMETLAPQAARIAKAARESLDIVTDMELKAQEAHNG